MKEQILEILNEHIQFMQAGKREKVAEEITAHVFEFIEWKDQVTRVNLDKKSPYYKKYLYWEEYLTLEELYQYWLTIKNVTK